jgi:hypothetical protein
VNATQPDSTQLAPPMHTAVQNCLLPRGPGAPREYDAELSSVAALAGAPVPSRVRSGEQTGAQLWFGGVSFTLRGPAELLATAAGLPYCAVERPGAVESSGALGGVSCQVDLAVSPLAEMAPNSVTKAVWGADRSLRWSCQGTTCQVEARGAQAQLAELGLGCWSAQAQVAPRRGALEALLNALSAVLLYRSGGAVLHAASVEAPGGVVAFIGPSGAGKSTACRHAGQLALFEGAPFQAPLFSVDRLGLSPSRQGWLAHALPGGTLEAGDSARSAAVALPLLGILRVRQAPSGARISSPVAGRKLALVRESVLSASAAPASEALLLEALAGLCQRVPVGELFFALGAPLGPVLSSWLGTQAVSGTCGAEVRP